MPTRQQTEAVLAKARKVLQRVNDLNERNRRLDDDLHSLRQQLEKERETNKVLGEQIKMLKLASHLTETSAKDTSELKRKVNEMIQTVELCIAQLSEENGT